MKTVFTFARLSTLLLLVAVALVTSCKNEDPVPQGNLIFYTNYDQTKFDRIDVIVDDKVLGQLTLSIDTKPDCNAAGAPSVVSLMIPVGSHSVAAKRYKAGVLVGNWKASTTTVSVEDCKRIRLTES